MVYASQHKSLAALEVRVHIDTTKKIKRYKSFAFQFDENLMEVLRAGSLPKNWRQEPPPPSLQQLGDAWVQAATFPILAAPSVIIPDELNYLLNPKHADYSLLCTAYQARIPFTVHVTVGGDIGHFHPQADGAALGATSHTDFRLLAELVRRMDGGGVYLNIGSAVTLPEVFLKAVTLVRNLGNQLTDITTANFDFIQSYRPLTNVVRRPNAGGAGKGYAITGHHELTIPLLAAELVCAEE